MLTPYRMRCRWWLLALACLGCDGPDEEGSGSRFAPNANAGSGPADTADAGSPRAGSGSMVFLPIDNPGSGGPTGGAPDPDALSGLDAADVTELCLELDAIIEASISDADLEQLFCTLYGVVISSTPDASGGATIDVPTCLQLESECLAAGGETISMTECDGAAYLEAAATCPLTKTDLTACFEAQAEALADLLGALECTATAGADLYAMALSGGDPAARTACAELADECPGLLPSDSSAAPNIGGGEPAADGCDETCPFSGDGACDDGGPGAGGPFCALGTDCLDCGPR